MKRRRLLRAGLFGGPLALAGCLGGSSGGSEGTPVDTHPAAANLQSQPRQGELGGHVVLTFEDPSCPTCAAFERKTVPKIRSKLVEPGAAAFVVRTYPVVYPWGEKAVQALEATFARKESAFWSLLDHYFESQEQFSVTNVLDRTEAFLDENTTVDGASVRADAESKAYDDAIQADIDAAENADLGKSTPIVLLFKNGRYVTKSTGAISYDVVATALGED